MAINLIIGRQGSGKTLYLVYLGTRAYRLGLRIYANFHLKLTGSKKDPNSKEFEYQSFSGYCEQIIEDRKSSGSKLKKLMENDMPDIHREYQEYKKPFQEAYFKEFGYYRISLYDIIECRLNSGIVLWDEIHNYISNRNSPSRNSRKIVDGFLSQLRKQGLSCYGTTQTYDKVDKRYRNETDILIYCRRFALIEGVWKEIIASIDLFPHIPVVIKLEPWDMYNYEPLNTVSFSGNGLFSKYDTKQVIKVDAY